MSLKKIRKASLWMITLIAINGCAFNHSYTPQNSPETLIIGQVQNTNHEHPLINKSPPKQNEQRITAHRKEAVKVKGIYVSGRVAGSAKLDQLIDLVETTSLNAMVIDIKDDLGRTTYSSKVGTAKQVESNQPRMIPDMPGLVQKLKKKNIYLIGRLVVFKDPLLAVSKKEWSMHTLNGRLWRDSHGIAWVNPYHKEVWQYNIDIAKEAARLGFDEIQFDYVRFPDNGKSVDREVRFNNPNQWTKSEVIRQFLREANKQISPTGALISADVFGLTTSTADDMGIGQQWGKIIQEVDFISPMIYPSHYSTGVYGVVQPDLQPYAIVKKALIDGIRKNKNVSRGIGRPVAVIRPWFQDFTASWVRPHQTYGYSQVMTQIQAAREQGIDQFLLWNPSNKYSYR